MWHFGLQPGVIGLFCYCNDQNKVPQSGWSQHELCNHTWNKVDFTRRSYEFVFCYRVKSQSSINRELWKPSTELLLFPPHQILLKHADLHHQRDTIRPISGEWVETLLRALKPTYCLSRKNGNHGNAIFQAGESPDRHAFKAPCVRFLMEGQW